MSIRLVLRSTDSLQLYPENQPYCFRVHLPRPLQCLRYWSISLLEFTYKGDITQPELFVYSNLCDDTIVGEREVPLLRRVYMKKQGNQIYSLPYKVPLRIGVLQDVHVYIKDHQHQTASFLDGVSTVEKIYFNECRPVSSYSADDAPIEITVPSQGNEYLDLRRSRLYMKCKITKTDGTDLTDQEKIGIINLPLQTIWSQIDTYMNGKLVSLNTSHYPWKAYLKQMLSNGTDVSKSQLQSQLYYQDTADMDDGNPVNGTNNGLQYRYGYTKVSRPFDLEGPMYEDIFRLEKYLINGVSLTLKFFRNKAPFIFMSAEESPNYKLHILDISFKACMIKVDSGILINHAEILKEQTAKYPLTRTEVKMNTYPTGSGSFIWQNVWLNNLPNKVYFAFVSQDGVNGSYTKYPFKFLNQAEDVVLCLNGESIPVRPMKLDVGMNRNYVTPFVNLFEVAEKWNKDNGLQITRENFTRGYTIYAFNLTPNDLGEEYLNLVRQGNIRFEVKFATVTTEILNCIAYAEFPALIEIDQSRDVKYTQV